jgi:hypothetical protein
MQKWVLFDILHVGDNPKKREAKCTNTCYKLPVSSLNIPKKTTNFRLPNPVTHWPEQKQIFRPITTHNPILLNIEKSDPFQASSPLIF